MTTEEKRMMQPAQEYIRKLQRKRNAGTEDCMLSSDLGRKTGITALDMLRLVATSATTRRATS